jgi:pyruvate-formate lyase
MTEVITLELPDTLAQRARAEAQRSNRPLEEVLIEWLNRVEATEPPVESLPDDQLLALSDAQLDPQQNDELSDLLARNREGQLDEAARQRLDELMQIYRLGLVRKAQALKEAVDRGLRAPLN